MTAGENPPSKSMTEVGDEFEQRVATILELLGAKVERSIKLCHKKVDILATYNVPGSGASHRVVVECKNESVTRNQTARVREFESLLRDARASGEAESALIVTAAPWGDEAKALAKEKGIKLLTFGQFLRSTIDFTDYLGSLIGRFDAGEEGRNDDAPLGSYYVAVGGTSDEGGRGAAIRDLQEHVLSWLGTTGQPKRHLAILGEYGLGKSSFCAKLARDLAAAYLERPGEARIPILINLRDFTKTFKAETLVSWFLDEVCGVVNPRYKLFHELNRAGVFLIILDGFDEMAGRLDRYALEHNLQELERLGASQEARLILTSRPEYFVDVAEEQALLQPSTALFAERRTDFSVVRLGTWGDEQIEEFLRRRIPLIKEAAEPWTAYMDKIREIRGLTDLSRRPVLLEMIAKTLPRLIASGAEISRVNLFDQYLRQELRRQRVAKGRHLLLADDLRFEMLERLALDAFKAGKAGFTFAEAKNHVAATAAPHESELEAFTREFLACSFLVREGDQYHFSHRSILEFVVAKALAAQIKAGDYTSLAARTLPPLVADFLVEMRPSPYLLHEYIGKTVHKRIKQTYLGGNAATILATMDSAAFVDRNLAKQTLRGASLRGADLRRTGLFGAEFVACDFVGALFTRSLLSAEVSDSKFDMMLVVKDVQPTGGDHEREARLAARLKKSIVMHVELVMSAPTSTV